MDVHSKANVDWKASIRGLIPVHSHSRSIFHDLLLQCHIHNIFHIPNSAGVAWMWKMLWMWHCRSRSWKMRLEWLCTGMRPLMEAFQSTLALLWTSIGASVQATLALPEEGPRGFFLPLGEGPWGSLGPICLDFSCPRGWSKTTLPQFVFLGSPKRQIKKS